MVREPRGLRSEWFADISGRPLVVCRYEGVRGDPLPYSDIKEIIRDVCGTLHLAQNSEQNVRHFHFESFYSLYRSQSVGDPLLRLGLDYGFGHGKGVVCVSSSSLRSRGSGNVFGCQPRDPTEPAGSLTPRGLRVGQETRTPGDEPEYVSTSPPSSPPTGESPSSRIHSSISDSQTHGRKVTSRMETERYVDVHLGRGDPSLKRRDSTPVAQDT